MRQKKKDYLGQNDYGVELCVVELVHSIGRHVEEGVEPLVHDVPDGGQPDNPGPLVLTRPARVLF